MKVEIQISWSTRKARVVRYLQHDTLPFEYEYLDFDLEDECASPEQAAKVVSTALWDAHKIGADDEVVTVYGPD